MAKLLSGPPTTIMKQAIALKAAYEHCSWVADHSRMERWLIHNGGVQMIYSTTSCFQEGLCRTGAILWLRLHDPRQVFLLLLLFFKIGQGQD